jgi:hypothetical protein
LDVESAYRLLDTKDQAEQRSVFRRLGDIPASERAAIIRKGFEQNLSYAIYDAVRAIGLVPPEDRGGLIGSVLRSGSQNAHWGVMKLIGTVPDEGERRRLIEAARDFEDLERSARGGGLYEQRPEPDRFFTKEFKKSGSGLTLLDKVPGDPDASLKHRVVLRHIEPAPLAAWRKAFEAAETWRDHGFDYVPVEPIVKADREGVDVDVATRVLRGTTMSSWDLAATGLYSDEISAARDRIIEGLKELGVEHGHTHPLNFMVVFERDADDRPMLERVPRVYLIDFDRAVAGRGSE